MPDHLIVIRAGATDYDLEDRIRGTLSIPLSAAGVSAAARAGERLSKNPPLVFYASADEAATETARVINAVCDLKPKPLTALVNIDMGLWQGRLVEEIRATQPRLHRQWQDNPWSVAPPEGELLEEACERVEGALERIFKRHPSGTVAVVVPRPLDAVVTWLVSGRSMGDLWRFDAEADLVDVLLVAAQWQPLRQGAKQISADHLDKAPSSQPFVSR